MSKKIDFHCGCRGRVFSPIHPSPAGNLSVRISLRCKDHHSGAGWTADAHLLAEIEKLRADVKKHKGGFWDQMAKEYGERVNDQVKAYTKQLEDTIKERDATIADFRAFTETMEDQ